MTDLMHYEKGCSPSAIQRKYSLTYEQGYELAERLKKTQELEHENLLLKEELKIAIPKENLRRYLNWIHKRIYQLADENELFKVANAELREQLEILINDKKTKKNKKK